MFNYGIIQISILVTPFLVLNPIYALIVITLIVVTFEFIIEILGYQIADPLDRLTAAKYNNTRQALVFYFELGRIPFDDFKNTVVDRWINKIPQLSWIKINRCGLDLWKTTNPEKLVHQILEVTDSSIETDDDCIKYCDELSKIEQDLLKPHWDIRLLENYQSDKSVVFIRMDHSYVDGVGLVSLISCLLDNSFKLTMKKRFIKFSLLQKILFWFKGAYYELRMRCKLAKIGTDKTALKMQEVG